MPMGKTYYFPINRLCDQMLYFYDTEGQEFTHVHQFYNMNYSGEVIVKFWPGSPHDQGLLFSEEIDYCEGLFIRRFFLDSVYVDCFFIDPIKLPKN